MIINTDTRFDRHRNVDNRTHGGDALRHQVRLAHQTSAKAAILYPIGWTADVEVNFIIASLLSQLGTMR
ncbi:Uncharacterised protein [Vibrio cholerae]|nr:Uncharacterised protein [Vibrio cholerae]CSI21497.1 Uncharacterised protein [Vibrio cholerae]